MNDKNIIISEGKRPIWQISIALLCYAGAVTLFIMIIVDSKFSSIRDAKNTFALLGFSIVLFSLGLRFSLIQNILFDIKNKRFKKEFDIGFTKLGKWKQLPNLEYISVFKQDTSSDSDGDGRKTRGIIYNVNVWHQTSKHFTIYSNHYPDPALEMGKHIATSLKIDLLDATDPHNRIWIESEKE